MNRDYDQCDVPPGQGRIRWERGVEWFEYNGLWYQAGQSMPPKVKEAWLSEHMRLDREEKKRRY